MGSLVDVKSDRYTKELKVDEVAAEDGSTLYFHEMRLPQAHLSRGGIADLTRNLESIAVSGYYVWLGVTQVNVSFYNSEGKKIVTTRNMGVLADNADPSKQTRRYLYDLD